MLQYIPDSCKTILEVGCGDGAFGTVLKSKFGAEVWGVELSKTSAEVARKVIDRVICGDFATMIDTLPQQYFDCLVFNDVLEHFIDPFSLLKGIKNLLNDGGYIVSSIPNVRYIGNLVELLIHKDWQYKSDGILDITHYRFFTKRSIARMFTNAGYDVITIEGINRTKSIKTKLLGLLTLGSFSDVDFMQIAIVARLPK